jgi:hypothetical protein
MTSFRLDALAATLQSNIGFISIASLVVLFFGCHNYLQEYIMSFPGFEVRGGEEEEEEW